METAREGEKRKKNKTGRRRDKIRTLESFCVCTSAVETFRFLGSTISQDLNVGVQHQRTIRKKAQQRIYFLLQLRKFNLPQELFYTAIIQSVLCTSITVWFGSATKQDRKQTTTDSRDCRENHWCQPACPPFRTYLYVSRVRKRA
ncbi:hypothetical protein L3Q82_025880, partial [Scortum barcoo]